MEDNRSYWIVKDQTATAKPKFTEFQLRFIACNGKAIAQYTGQDKSIEVEVTSRKYAVALTAKAVQNANAAGLPIHIQNGEENNSDPLGGLINAPLGYDAMSAVMAEEAKAEFNYRNTGLFDPTW